MEKKVAGKKCFYQKHLSTICCCPREFAVIAQVWRNFCVTSLDPLCSPGAAHGYSNGLKANRGSLLNAETICAIKKAQGSYKKEESLWKITPCTGCPEFERKRAFGFQIVFYKKNRNLFQMNISLGNSSWTAVLLFGDFGRLFCWGLWWSVFCLFILVLCFLPPALPFVPPGFLPSQPCLTHQSWTQSQACSGAHFGQVCWSTTSGQAKPGSRAAAAGKDHKNEELSWTRIKGLS